MRSGWPIFSTPADFYFLVTDLCSAWAKNLSNLLKIHFQCEGTSALQEMSAT